MKEIPEIKRKPLSENEIRVINIGQSAIKELLFENLLQNKADYFDVEDISDNELCVMEWDQQSGILTYAIIPMKCCTEGCDLNFDYIRSEYGTTVESLFSSNRYRSLTITEQVFVQRKCKYDT